METTLATVKINTPVLDVINKSLFNILKKNLNEVVSETNKGIERGVATDDTARDANAVVVEGRKAIKLVNEIRLQFTRPIDDGKKRLIKEVRDMLQPLVDSNDRLNTVCLERAERIRREEAEAQRKYEEEKRIAEEKAEKERQRRQAISDAQGGTGENIKPVAVEEPARPIVTTGMRETARTRSIPDVDKIAGAIEMGIHNIPGINIYQVWKYDIDNAKLIPEEYRRTIRA